MKVLHVSPLLFGPDGVVGGGERYPLELALAMARLSETRLVAFGQPRETHFSPRGPRPGRASAASDPGRDGNGLPVRVYRPPRYLGTKGLSPVAPQLVAEIARADVVHCHQMHTFLADQCVLLGRLLRKPVFLTDHAGGDRNFNRRLRTWERTTGLLLVSDFNAREFARFGSRVVVIHGGVDPQRFAPLPIPRQRRALYAGRLIPYKGIQFLIQGVAPETEVRLAGPSYHEAYERHLRDVAKGRNVHFAGAVLGDDLRREYCQAGALVLPSVDVDLYGKRYPKSEILGLVLLEAMACETPVVCSRLGGIPELVVDGVTGTLVPPGDAPALGAAVEALLDDPAMARRMGQAGRERVLAHFTWQRVAERCLGAYRTLSDRAQVER